MLGGKLSHLAPEPPGSDLLHLHFQRILAKLFRHISVVLSVSRVDDHALHHVHPEKPESGGNRFSADESEVVLKG